MDRATSNPSDGFFVDGIKTPLASAPSRSYIQGSGKPIMIRSLLRLIGVVALAAGFILLVYDGAKSIADSRIYIYKLGQLWTDVNAASLQAVQASIQTSLPAQAWDPGFTTILDQPSWLIFGIVGTIFILLGRKRKPLIGYAR